MSTINVLDSTGATVAVQAPLAPGQAVSANSRPVVIASDQSAVSITSTLLPSSIGTKTKANSLAVTFASDDPVTAVAGNTTDAAAANGAAGTLASYLRAIKDASTDTTTSSPILVKNPAYKTVAASTTLQLMGATGAVGDILSHVVIIPASTSPGAVTITDGNVLAVPTLNAPSTATTGGTLAAATYYYKVTALGASGETIGSNEVSQATTGTTSTVSLSWNAITGATGYRVYRGTAAAGENVFYAPGNVTSYTDTGATNVAGSPPSTNTATSTAPITIFAGGASSVTTLIPFSVPLGLPSASGAWRVTTGANVSAIGAGKFT